MTAADEWLLRGPSLDAASGVVLPGVHLAAWIERVARCRVDAALVQALAPAPQAAPEPIDLELHLAGWPR